MRRNPYSLNPILLVSRFLMGHWMALAFGVAAVTWWTIANTPIT